MADEIPNKDKDIVFETPTTTVSEEATTVNPNIEFEKYKLKMNFYKWLLGTFFIAVITLIINWGFKDRAVGMDEISKYDKYATDILILNDNPIKKRMIAQFFSTVTPSDNLKCGWKLYYSEVEKEYRDYIKKSDSLYIIYDGLMKKEALSNYEKYKMNEIQKKLQLIAFEEKLPTILPVKEKIIASTEEFQKILSKRLSATDYEKTGFENLLKKDLTTAITNFKSSSALYPKLHNVEEISNLLNLKKPKTDSEWSIVYKSIIDNYSWGMAFETRNKFLEAIQKTK